MLGISKNESKFRPISLLEIPYKLVTGTANRRIMKTLHKHEMLISSPYGNVIGGSTTTPLRMTITIHEQAKAQKSHVYGAYLDLASAFDTIPCYLITSSKLRLDKRLAAKL